MTTGTLPPAQDYLACLGIAGEEVQRVIAGLSNADAPAIAALQAQLAAADPGAGSDPNHAWLRWCVQRAYSLPVPDPQHALMPALLPLRRQHMTAQPLHHGFGRQLLGLFLYRPAARVLRRLQLLAGRVERA